VILYELLGCVDSLSDAFPCLLDNTGRNTLHTLGD
jgi:hypothetical protein